MARRFKVSFLVTGVLNAAGSAFTSFHRNDVADTVQIVHELTGPIAPVRLNVPFDYGCTVLAGEPCASDPSRTILFLRIVSFDTATPAVTHKVMEFSYRTRNLPGSGWGALAAVPPGVPPGPPPMVPLDDPPDPWDPDPITDPAICPDPESELPEYDETSNDETPHGDDDEDPATGESGDCDGTIGIAA